MTSHPLPKISAPAARALEGAGIATLEQAAEYSEAGLLALHGFGPSGIVILRAALTELGLELAD
ncbi:DNA-binding protein [Paeniglutamicibacter sp.]|uniref:DNA-binding protein n=1 Tax=Paeniglutamicibacter sp. TaxID=1934391 RepID=UPI003988F5D1